MVRQFLISLKRDLGAIDLNSPASDTNNTSLSQPSKIACVSMEYGKKNTEGW